MKCGANNPLFFRRLPYKPSPDLIEAVNLAVTLQRPLLLMGELLMGDPGCDKHGFTTDQTASEQP